MDQHWMLDGSVYLNISDERWQPLRWISIWTIEDEAKYQLPFETDFSIIFVLSTTHPSGQVVTSTQTSVCIISKLAGSYFSE